MAGEKREEVDDIHNETTEKLESINKKLKLLDKKIDDLPTDKNNKSYFFLNLMITLIVLMVAITIPLLTELLDYSKEQLLFVIICYFFVLIILLVFSYLIGKKVNL